MKTLNEETTEELEDIAAEARGVTDPLAKSLLTRALETISKAMANKPPAPADDSVDDEDDEDDEDEDSDEGDDSDGEDNSDEDEDDEDEDSDEGDDDDSDEDEDEAPVRRKIKKSFDDESDDDEDLDESDDDEDDEDEDEVPVRKNRKSIRKSFEDDVEEYEDDTDPFLSKSLDDDDDEDVADPIMLAMLDHLEGNEEQSQTIAKCLLDINEKFTDVSESFAGLSERLSAIEGNQNGQSDAILEISKSIDASAGVAEENTILVKSLTERVEGVSRTANGTVSNLGIGTQLPNTLRKSFGEVGDTFTSSEPETRFGMTHNQLVSGVSIYARDNPDNDKGIDAASASKELKKSLSNIGEKFFKVASETLDIKLTEE